MRAIEVELLNEGMKIAKTIYDDSGRILLSEGATLTKGYIRKLGQYGIPFVYVEDELIGPLQVEDVIHERVRIQTVKALKQVVDNGRMKNDLDLKPISNMVNEILDDLKSVPNVLVQLLDTRTCGTYMYNHSVGVCVLSLLTGIGLGLDELKLKNLGMGALLHDIGKCLNTGEEHTVYGYKILRNQSSLNITAAHVAYQHHEKFDGTGFPRQLKGYGIHLYAAITNIANVYDNLVSNPDMDERLYPYQALELIVAESGKSFHPDLVKAFSRNIAPYPVGSTVQLNNGGIGIVISVPQNFPTRPVVKIIKDNNGNILTKFPDVDLMEETTLFVNEVLNEKERQQNILNRLK